MSEVTDRPADEATRHREDLVFPEPVVACLRHGRPPTPHEIDAVAARIWREAHPDRGPWSVPASNAADHRRCLRAARAALGMHCAASRVSDRPFAA